MATNNNRPNNKPPVSLFYEQGVFNRPGKGIANDRGINESTPTVGRQQTRTNPPPKPNK